MIVWSIISSRRQKIDYLEKIFVLTSTDLNALFSPRIPLNESVWIGERDVACFF